MDTLLTRNAKLDSGFWYGTQHRYFRQQPWFWVYCSRIRTGSPALRHGTHTVGDYISRMIAISWSAKGNVLSTNCISVLYSTRGSASTWIARNGFPKSGIVPGGPSSHTRIYAFNDMNKWRRWQRTACICGSALNARERSARELEFGLVSGKISRQSTFIR